MHSQKIKHNAILSVLAAGLYLAIMLTFNNNQTIVEQHLSQENSFVNYVETQIGNQEKPTNNICTIINLCKSPIKKLSNDDFSAKETEFQIRSSELAYFCRQNTEENFRHFSTTDIIFPFNYFW